MHLFATLFVLSATLHTAEPKVRRDVLFAEPKNERQTLDVYAPAEGKGRPIVFWIHGGGWKAGDKKSVAKKPQVFLDKGFVLVVSDLSCTR